jgi:hypothetical protein
MAEGDGAAQQEAAKSILKFTVRRDWNFNRLIGQ